MGRWFESNRTCQFKGEVVKNNETVESMMEEIEKQNGNVIFIKEIYKSKEDPVLLPTPDFFSLFKMLFRKN